MLKERKSQVRTPNGKQEEEEEGEKGGREVQMRGVFYKS